MTADKLELTVQTIKAVAKEFDIEGVTKLSYTGKGVTRITAVDQAINLVELNLSSNAITKIEGLGTLIKLKKLHLTCNKLTKLENLEGLESLEHLLVQGNQIRSLDDIRCLAKMPNLRSLYLKDVDGTKANPVCSLSSYKPQVLNMLPNLKNLDGERLRTAGGTAFAAATAELAEEAHYGNTAPSPRNSEARRSSASVRPSESWLKGFSWGEDDGAGRELVLRGVENLKDILGECKALESEGKAMVGRMKEAGGGGGTDSAVSSRAPSTEPGEREKKKKSKK